MAVQTDDERIRAAVDALFVDLRAAAPTDDIIDALDAERADVVIEISSAPQRWDVGLADGPVASFSGPAAAMRELVRLVNRAALDHDPDRLHLHASAVTSAGRLLVLSAPSGTGKSTTAAALVLAGATYVTDETVAVGRESAEIHAFPKPITARRGAVEMLPELEAGAVTVTSDAKPPLLIPVSALGVSWSWSATPFAVAVLHRDDSASREPLIEQMSRADACVALVQESLDFDRFGDDALDTIARLCTASHCFRVRLGEPRATAAALINLVSHLPDIDGFVQSSRSEGAGTSGSTNASCRWIPGEDARWVSVDDEVVLQHACTGSVLSLRPAAAAWWRAMAVGAGSSADDESMTPIVALLTEEGFIRRSNE